MLEAFALTLVVVGPAASSSGAAAVTVLQEQAIPLMTPLEHVSDPLKRALSSLTHAANQTCEVKAAIVDIKAALKDIAAGEAFLGQHRDAAALPQLPPAITPNFTPPPRPAPRRNEMLEGALKNLEAAFHRVTQTTGGDWGGARDKAYRHMDEAATNLLAAMKNANVAFSQGRRGELPSCKPDSGAGRD
jgi:hypothetical protein